MNLEADALPSLLGSPSSSSGQQYFDPFPEASSTLIVAPPFAGKTYFVKQLLESQELYFKTPVTKVVVVNCDERVKFYELELQSHTTRPLPEVVQFTWDTFDSGSLNKGDVVLVDDLQVITPRLRELITALTHHCFLGHLFVICHGVLGTRMYELLSYVHRVCLFTSSTAVVRLGLYIVQHFYVDVELKEFLKRVLGVCERQQEILLLEINNLPCNVQPYHVALSHLTRLKNHEEGSYAMAYSYPSKSQLYARLARERHVVCVTPRLLDALPKPEYLLEGSFVILLSSTDVKELRDAAAVATDSQGDATKSANGSNGQHEECIEEKNEWNEAVAELERRLEDYVVPGKWHTAKNLLKEILQNTDICILQNKKEMMLESRESTRVSILDFVMNAIRREGPNELKLRGDSREYRLYRLYSSSLLSHLCPKSLFKNKMFLLRTAEGSSPRRGEMKKKSRNKVGRRPQRSPLRSNFGAEKRHYAEDEYEGDSSLDGGKRRSRRRGAYAVGNGDSGGSPFLFSSHP